jgi:hypothetical protein
MNRQSQLLPSSGEAEGYNVHANLSQLVSQNASESGRSAGSIQAARKTTGFLVVDVFA